MSRRDDTVRLHHMHDHAREAVQMAVGRKRSDLESDRQFGLAMTRLLEIMGEAAPRVSETARQNWPEIPWAKVVGLRNRLIHGYDSVDFDILWTTVIDDLPPLITTLNTYLKTGDPGTPPAG